MVHVEQLDDYDDRTRRDALARSLCARLCDERRGLDVLQILDAVLSLVERESVERASLRYMLEHDRYSEDEGPEDDRVRRRWWNLGMKHATALVRAFGALNELRRQSSWPDSEAAP